MAYAKWSNDLLPAIQSRVSSGETVSSIAADLNVHKSALYKRLKRKGVELGRQGWSSTLTLPDQTDRAYIAGIIDGEGSIMLAKGKWWHVKVGMTDRPVIEWLASHGGTFQVQPRRPPRKEAYTWTVARNRDVQTLLLGVLPYLHVKQALAERVLHELAT